MEMEISDEIRITSTNDNRPTEWTMHEQCVWHAGASKQNAAALSCRRPTCCQAGVLPVTASSNHSIVCITRRCRLRQLGTPPDAGEETFYLDGVGGVYDYHASDDPHCRGSLSQPAAVLCPARARLRPGVIGLRSRPAALRCFSTHLS